MHKRFSHLLFALALAVAFLATAAGTAFAAPSLTLDRADRAAHRWADDEVQAWAEAFDADGIDDYTGEPIDPEDDPGAFLTIDNYVLDPCERVGDRRAVCTITYELSDFDLCDTEIRVKTTRRGRLHVADDDLVCDSELL